ncbi:MAG: hypothetical protein PHE27_07910 [Alphaproteobacteria bacterium]|nr:hypothetical protein [Alphaproteobacteria bacterium]
MMQSSASPSDLCDSLTQEFDSIDSYLIAVHEILNQGHMPDIADLDERIARLCSRVEEAPPELQEDCLAKLDDLLNKLSDCENEMTAFQLAKKA